MNKGIIFWVILSAILELFSTKRIPFYLHLFHLVIIVSAKPISNLLFRIGEISVKQQTRTTISNLVDVPNDDQLTKICEKHNYNKLAVLRELLKE